MRLVNGPQEGSGRVEILHDGQWGTVCDDYFGTEEALVVCRAFGYNDGVARGYATYGSGMFLGMKWNLFLILTYTVIIKPRPCLKNNSSQSVICM